MSIWDSPKPLALTMTSERLVENIRINKEILASLSRSKTSGEGSVTASEVKAKWREWFDRDFVSQYPNEWRFIVPSDGRLMMHDGEPICPDCAIAMISWWDGSAADAKIGSVAICLSDTDVATYSVVCERYENARDTLLAGVALSKEKAA